MQSLLLQEEEKSKDSSNWVKAKNVETNIIVVAHSKKELAEICKCSLRVLEQIVADLTCEVNFAAQSHIKKGGYHNREVFYDDYLVKLIQAKLLSNQANQGRASDTIKQATTQAVEKDLVITEVIKSGNQEAFDQLMKQYKLAFDTAQENKRLLEQTKQMEHALNYTAVIGWKKWSDLKRELAQEFEIFKHRINFKTVAAEAGLVEETDYAERIYGEDCFPTTMVSESGIDKIYDCFDR